MKRGGRERETGVREGPGKRGERQVTFKARRKRGKDCFCLAVAVLYCTYMQWQYTTELLTTKVARMERKRTRIRASATSPLPTLFSPSPLDTTPLALFFLVRGQLQ